ncbi:MAG: hypothetical protein ACKVU4_14630 [Phycisphaerales bacterium]
MTPTLNGVYVRAIGVATVLAAAGAAWAQETAQLIVDVSNSTLAPGESTEVHVSVAYAPGIGGTAVWNSLRATQHVGTVAGFSLAVFNVNAFPVGAASGSWSNLAVAPGFHPFSSAGTIAGNSVAWVEVGTGFGPPLAVVPTTNPVLIWSGTWTVSAGSGAGAVNLSTAVLNSGYVHLWLQGGAIGTYAVEDAWPCTNGQAVITVIPAPGVIALTAIGAALLTARRRHGTERCAP